MAKQPTSMEDRIEVENGKIVRILRAEYDKPGNPYSAIDVYKEDEDGNCWKRNIYSSIWGGYVVMFPGYPRSISYWCYDGTIAEEEEWIQCDKRSTIGPSRKLLTETERGLILMYHYDFKYVFKKYNFYSLKEVMDKLIVWKQHPELELLLGAGFEKLGMCKSLYRLKPENQKEVMKFCRNNQDANRLSFREIRVCMKSNEPDLMIRYFNMIPAWKREGWDRSTHYAATISIDDFKYLNRKNLCNDSGIYLFTDYKTMLQRSHHNNSDEYWRHPQDLQKMHDKLLEERRIEEEMKRRIEEEKKAAEMKKKTSNFQKVCRKYQKYNNTVDDYRIYISNDFDDWKKQADTLHQCIISADYMQRVANRECLIVFIRKIEFDEPIATVQLFPNKKIGQFYANEFDRNNCKPTEEVQQIFYRWLENVTIKEAI